jgi:hypothetical protein
LRKFWGERRVNKVDGAIPIVARELLRWFPLEAKSV